MKTNQEIRFPLVHLLFKARKPGLDMRIADTPFNGAVPSREHLRPKVMNEFKEVSELFGLYCETMKKRELQYDAKEFVFSSSQKTLEASTEQRVKEVEGEEAIELILQSLQHLQRNHHHSNQFI